jgi:Flp pilus assembly protein TadG
MRRERGSVTAEAAVVLPVVVLVVMALSSALSVHGAAIRCQDAAREAARAAARSEPEAEVRALAARAAPAGSTIQISSEGDQITVTVSASVHLLGGLLPDVSVSRHATSLKEPEVDP